MKKAFTKEQFENTNQVFEHEEKSCIRINKYLSEAGVCSRRQADKWVAEGRVRIDGELATAGAQVFVHQSVVVDDQKVVPKQRHVYIALNKPEGITCTTDTAIPGNISDFMDFPVRIFPIGRLDKDSCGLILLTSDGDIVNKILRAENNHEKEYLVQTDRPVTQAFLRAVGQGVEITNMRYKTREVTKPCVVTRVDARTFRIVLTQGLNRQIRRMCSELGFRVVFLRRVRVMNITLGDLQPGQWRYVRPEELDTLQKTFSHKDLPT